METQQTTYTVKTRVFEEFLPNARDVRERRAHHLLIDKTNSLVIPLMETFQIFFVPRVTLLRRNQKSACTYPK